MLVSFTLHTAFLAFIPPLLSRPDSSLKRPLWVDLVELKDPKGLLVSPPPAPAPEATPDEPPPAPQRVEVRKQRPEDDSSEEPERPAWPGRNPRPLPSPSELVPSMKSLLGSRNARKSPLYVEPLQETEDGIHRGPQYEAYLREVKEAVKKNWNVSGDGEAKTGTTILRISIDTDGSLASLDMLQSSGMILHDYEALEAIKLSFPLRSPPESLLDEHGKLSIRFSFHYFLAPPG